MHLSEILRSLRKGSKEKRFGTPPDDRTALKGHLGWWATIWCGLPIVNFDSNFSKFPFPPNIYKKARNVDI